MTFSEAVASGLTRFVRWEGRAPRSEFWWFYLFNVLLGIAGGVADALLGVQYVVGGLVWLAMLLPNLSVTVRRLHDTGRSGWSLWFALVPIAGPVVVFLWMLTAGHRGPNRFGPPQLGRFGMAGADKRYQPPPIYPDAAGYRPSGVPQPRRRPGWTHADGEHTDAPAMPPFNP